MKNFKLIGTIDASELLKEVNARPELWNKIPLRTTYKGTAHVDVSDIWVRYPDLTNYTISNLHEIQDDSACIDYPAMHEIPCLKSFIDAVVAKAGGAGLDRVLITNLKSGGRILPHVDEGTAAATHDRYHVVLDSDDGNTFRAGDETVSMKTGEIWFFDNKKEHEVHNNSRRGRVHLIIDLNMKEKQNGF